MSKIYKKLVRKLFETGIMRVDFEDEEGFSRFLDWQYPDKHQERE